MAFLEGYVTGLALIVLIGPVLFVLVQSTLERGKGHGFAVAVGIFVSDIVAVLLCAFGFARFFTDPAVQPWLAVGGGLLLLGFGIHYLWARGAEYRREASLDAASLSGFFMKGFLVNFVNPVVFMVWLGIIGAATVRHGYGLGLAWFMAGTIVGVLTLDSVKVLLAHKIRPLLKPKVLKIVFRISGVLLLAFGVRLLFLGLAGGSI